MMKLTLCRAARLLLTKTPASAFLTRLPGTKEDDDVTVTYCTVQYSCTVSCTVSGGQLPGVRSGQILVHWRSSLTPGPCHQM